MSCELNSRAKILVLTVPAWNSRIGANTWEALLNNYPSKNLASICIRPEAPDSDICSRYFSISEGAVIKSLYLPRHQTGREIAKGAVDENELAEHKNRYAKMKRKRRYSMLIARELIWKFGKWKSFWTINNRGYRELITNELNGLLFNHSDIIQLSKDINTLLNDIPSALQYGTIAFSKAQAYKTESVYKELKELMNTIEIYKPHVL